MNCVCFLKIFQNCLFFSLINILPTYNVIMFSLKDGSAYWQLKYDDAKYDDIFYRHMHNNVEFHLITRGNGVINIDGNETEVAEYDFIIIPPHCYHVFNVDKSHPYERFILNFPVDYYDIDLSNIADKPHIYNLSNHHDIIDNFIKIDECNKILDEEDFKKALHLYVQLIMIQIKNTQFNDGATRNANHLTSSALRFIDDNLLGPLDVTSVANALYISKSHLQNTFYKSMKIGLKTYIIQRKMDKAQIMLNEGKQAQEVAKALGYKTYSTFYKSYVNTYGHPPKTSKKK